MASTVGSRGEPITVPPPPRPGDMGPYPTASERYPGAAGPLSHEEEEAAYGGRPLLGGLHIPGASQLYTLLGLLQLIAGILCIITPYKISDIIFRDKYLPRHREDLDVLHEELWRMLGATLFASAITCSALKIGADRHLLAEPSIQRLQHGSLWFALLALVLVVVHVAFVKSATLWALLIGVVIMGPTLLLPTIHLGISGGFAFSGESLRICLGNILAPHPFTLSVLLYSLLTILFTVAGATFVVIPKMTLDWTFGYHTGQPAVLLWQLLGSAMLLLFPAITYTLQERALAGRLHLTLPKVLNVGLLVAALFSILELGSLLVTSGVEKSRWLLPFLFTHWVLVLLATIVGLSAHGEHGATAAYEYEPLQGGERMPTV